MMLRYSLAAAALTFGLAGTAAAQNLEVSAQSVGNTATVDAVDVDEAAFVVVHESDAQGNIVAPASIGHAAVAAGGETDIRIPLEREVTAGERLFVMLHRDTGEPGVYEFGPGSVDVDPPMIREGKPVVRPVPVQ
ncbi:hypothetical protein LG302_13640 [Halomonas organivorans]